MQEIGMYIHVPFCQKRCAYCDFISFAGCVDKIPDYIECVCIEIGVLKSQVAHKKIRSIYFGGGTPSLLLPIHIEKVLNTIRSQYDLSEFVEITLEANPGTEIGRKAREFYESGINRISLGVQSPRNEELALLERIHTHQQTCLAVKDLHKAGFRNINLDLIYGIPDQTLAIWKTSLQEILELVPEHLSIYCLTLEPSVKMAKQIKSGLLRLPEDDEIAEMYAWAMEYLDRNGYDQYEISNWARRDHRVDYRSWHNLQYWRAGEYLGFGAGAHGYLAGSRYENVHRIDTYINRLTSKTSKNQSLPALFRKTRINKWESMLETMMLGLRLTKEGVKRDAFFEKYKVEMSTIFSAQIMKLLDQGIIEYSPDKNCLRLTKHGRQIGNIAFREFVAIPEPKEISIQ